MKRIEINIPTKKNEFKDFFMYLFSWMTHSGRMKRHSKIMNELFLNLYNELNSGYWSKDISEYMRNQLTNPYNGKIREMINNAKRKMI